MWNPIEFARIKLDFTRIDSEFTRIQLEFNKSWNLYLPKLILNLPELNSKFTRFSILIYNNNSTEFIFQKNCRLSFNRVYCHMFLVRNYCVAGATLHDVTSNITPVKQVSHLKF